MVIYLVTILLVSITGLIAQYATENYSGLLRKGPQNYFVFLTAIILIMVAGLRWRVGTDYVTYSLNYPEYAATFWESIITFNEPGIKGISALSKLIKDDYGTMFFISSFITVGLCVLAMSKHSNLFLFSTLLYIFIGTWHGSFNGVRQYLACAIIFSGHSYIIKKDFIKYLMVIIIASLFHQSAIVMILLYYVPQKKMNPQSIFLIMLAVATILLSYDFLFQILETVAEIRNEAFVVTSYTTRSINPLRIAVTLAPILLYYFLSSNKLFLDEDYFYINVMFVNFAVFLIASNSAYLARFGIYTNIFLVLSIPRLLKNEDNRSSKLFQFTILLSYFIYWFYEVYRTPNLTNFQWIFVR